MEERAQGATEYLLMLAGTLAVVVLVLSSTFEIFDSLSSSVEDQISEVEDELVEELA